MDNNAMDANFTFILSEGARVEVRPPDRVGREYLRPTGEYCREWNIDVQDTLRGIRDRELPNAKEVWFIVGGCGRVCTSPCEMYCERSNDSTGIKASVRASNVVAVESRTGGIVIPPLSPSEFDLLYAQAVHSTRRLIAGNRVICKNGSGHEECGHTHVISGNEYTVKSVTNTMVELNEVSGRYYSSRFELIQNIEPQVGVARSDRLFNFD